MGLCNVDPAMCLHLVVPAAACAALHAGNHVSLLEETTSAEKVNSKQLKTPCRTL